MKKRTIAYIALVLFGIGTSLFIPRFHEKWTDTSTGSQLVLSLKGSSPNMESPRLEIRCDGAKSEVRLYVPIGVKAPFGGPAEGPAKMGLKEEFQDSERQPVPLSDMYDNIWIADSSQDFAVKQDSLSFIRRIMGKEWLVIRGLAYSDTPTGAGFSIDFPVMGLVDYQGKITTSCPDA